MEMRGQILIWPESRLPEHFDGYSAEPGSDHQNDWFARDHQRQAIPLLNESSTRKIASSSVPNPEQSSSNE